MGCWWATRDWLVFSLQMGICQVRPGGISVLEEGEPGGHCPLLTKLARPVSGPRGGPERRLPTAPAGSYTLMLVRLSGLKAALCAQPCAYY